MRASKVGSWVLCSIAAGGLLPAAAQAEIGTFRGYVGAAPTSYQISFDQNAPNFGGGLNYQGKTAKSSYTAVNLGLAWTSPKGIYVDVSGQKSLSATHDFWSDVGSSSEDFSHDAYTLTGGYSHVLSGSGMSISGFGGYTQASTSLGAPSPPFNFSEDKFQSKAIFLGVGWGMPALGGQVGASLAIASGSGTWKDDNGFNNNADYMIGYSVGASYTYKINQSFGVTADLRHQQYRYDFGVYATNAPAYSVTEKITSAGVRLSYQF